MEKQFKSLQKTQLIQHASLFRIFTVGNYYGIIIAVVQRLTESHLTPLLSVWYLGGRAAPRLR